MYKTTVVSDFNIFQQSITRWAIRSCVTRTRRELPRHARSQNVSSGSENVYFQIGRLEKKGRCVWMWSSEHFWTIIGIHSSRKYIKATLSGTFVNFINIFVYQPQSVRIPNNLLGCILCIYVTAIVIDKLILVRTWIQFSTITMFTVHK